MNLPFRPISNPGGRKGKMLAAFLILGLAGSGAAPAAGGARLAEVQAFNAQLLGHDSATETLGAWCASHHLAADPAIHAERDAQAKAPSAQTLRLLRAGNPSLVRYRHVRLTCGARVLSEADNWYRPDILTPEMNRALETTRTPFGVAVAALGFHRATLSVAILPENSGAILRHRAMLSTSGGVPFSVVEETYTSEVLGDLGVNRRPR